MLRIALFEDEAEDRESLQRSIQGLGDGILSVDAFPPPSDLDLSNISGGDADLYLIDYELDTVQDDDTIANYRGTTLAARLREIKPEHPIVLLTRSDLPVWASNQRTVEVSSAFDSILFKDKELRSAREVAYSRLISLACGYGELRESQDRSVSALLDLLDTDDRGNEQARESIPPDNDWQAVEAAKWIRTILIRFPGVLYSPVYAATALGITLDSFSHPRIQELFDPAKYRGPFHLEQQRWWRHTLFDVAIQSSEGRGAEQGFYEGFRSFACECLGVEINPSRDEQTDVSPADTVCFFLDIPIRIENSLPYRPDTRPSIMDEARVSFKAIRERNDIDENHLDEAHREIMREIQRQPHVT